MKIFIKNIPTHIGILTLISTFYIIDRTLFKFLLYIKEVANGTITNSK